VLVQISHRRDGGWSNPWDHGELMEFEIKKNRAMDLRTQYDKKSTSFMVHHPPIEGAQGFPEDVTIW
jgi:hypothetical protein